MNKYSYSFLLVLVCLVSGCSTSPTKHFMPPDHEVRASLDDVYLDVMPYSYQTNLDFEVVGAGDGAVAGAATGGMLPPYILSHGCVEPISCVVFLGAGLVLMPVGAVAGGLVGAAAAPSEEQVSDTQTEFMSVVNDFEYSNILKYHFIKHQNEGAKHYKIVALDNNTITLPNKSNVIELRITKMHWETVGSFDPDLFLISNVEARLTKDSHVNETYSRTWEYQSRVYDLDMLLENDSKEMKNLMEKALSLIAKKAVYDLLVNNNEEKEQIHPKSDEVRTISASHEQFKEI